MKSKEFLKIANRFRDGFVKGLKNAFHIHRPSEYKNLACQESGMYESWKKRLKTDPETAAIIEKMPATTIGEEIAQLAEKLAQFGYITAEAEDAIRSVVCAAIKPEPLSHLTNNWKKMHGLTMRRRTLQERKRKNVSNGIRRNHRGTKKKQDKKYVLQTQEFDYRKKLL